jgi:tetratricopeptide (TPR) repeat protein
MKGWFIISPKENPQAHVFIATIYYENKKNDLALNHVEKAIKLTKNPKENWLVFAVSLNYEKSNYKKAESYLKKLAKINSKKKSYWSQLAGSLLNQNKSNEALAVLELAYKLDLLDKDGEIYNIASLYMQTDIPYHAAALLEKSLKDGKIKQNKKSYQMLSNAYVAARENKKALEPLTKAAKLSKDGKLYLHRGRLLLGEEQWKKAIESFDMAIKKGKLTSKGGVYVEKAIAYIQLKDFKRASQNIQTAMKFEDSKKQAVKWKSYMEAMTR